MAEAVKHKLGTNHHNFRGIGLKPRKMAEAVKHNLTLTNCMAEADEHKLDTNHQKGKGS